MKRANQIFGMMFMAALLVVGASSCNKEKDKTVSSFDFLLPAIEGESPLSEEKAYIDLTDNQVKWYAGDQMMVYSLDEDYTQSTTAIYDGAGTMTGQTSVQFSGTPLTQGSIGYFAFYPASKASQTIEESNRASFNVGEEQICTTDLFASTSYAGRIFMDPQAAVGACTADQIVPFVRSTFKHIFGFVTVKLKDSSNSGKLVKSVSINDPHHHLTGSISLELPKLNLNLLNAMKTLGQQYKAGTNLETYASSLNGYLHEIGYLSTPAGNEVKLDCSTIGDITITNANKFFLLPVRPGALMNGFTITVTYSDDNTLEIQVPADKKYITIPGTYTNISVDLATGSVL
jgi:hypothetical protein